MPIFYDDEGNPVEGALAPDEAKALQEKAATIEKEREELKTQLKDKEEALWKASDKEINFKALRNMSDEEKKKLSAETLGLKTEVEDLRTRLETKDKAALTEAKEDVLSELCGEDTELRTKVEAEFGFLSLPDGTPSELKAKYKKAFKNSVGSSSSVNPLNVGLPSGGYDDSRNERRNKEYGMTELGMELARKMGLGYAERLDRESKKK